MANNVVIFPTEHKNENKGTWLAGYAAGLADAKRSGADVEELIRASGLTLQEFINGEADEYDIEELKEFFD